jgi:hypothetical protein
MRKPNRFLKGTRLRAGIRSVLSQERKTIARAEERTVRTGPRGVIHPISRINKERVRGTTDLGISCRRIEVNDFHRESFSGSVTVPAIRSSVIRAMWSMTKALKKICEMMKETMPERPMRNREANHETKCQSQMSQRLSGLAQRRLMRS